MSTKLRLLRFASQTQKAGSADPNPIVAFKTILICSAIIFALVAWLRLPSYERLFEEIGVLLVIIALAEIIGGVLSMMHITNNLVYNLSWPMEFVVLMRIALGQVKEYRRLIMAFSGVFACAWLSELFFGNMLARLATISVMLGAVMVTMIYALLLWRLSNAWEGSLRLSPEFWFYLGVTLYFSACTPLLGSMNYFASVDRPLASKLYWLLQAVCVIHYWMIGRACMVERRALIAQR